MHPDAEESLCCNNEKTLLGNNEEERGEKLSNMITVIDDRLNRPSSSNELQPLLRPNSSNNSNHLNFRKASIGSIEIDATNVEEMSKTSGAQKKSSKRIDEVDSSQAWFTLALVFIINANSLSMLKVYGLIFERIVAQKYYTREEASWPVSTASTIQNLAGLLTPLMAMSMSWRSIEMIQTVLLVGANVGAYFSNNLTLDILYIGIIQGVAFSIRYNMNIIVNNDYFQKYRGTAMGLCLAGSSCGVFFIKPLITHVLDKSEQDFRNAYLAMGIMMSFNVIFGIFMRKPRDSGTGSEDIEKNQSNDEESQENSQTDRDSTELSCGQVDVDISLKKSLLMLLKNPSIHCIWIMQTIYFYISRTYTIFIVDYGVDKGFGLAQSRNLLNFWVYGEVGGRLLLGSFVDSKLLNLKWNIILVNVLLALFGFALIPNPNSSLTMAQNQQFSLIANTTTAVSLNLNQTTTAQALKPQIGESYFWFFGMSIALIAAFSSLLNIMIVPFGQEYLGKKNVPWAFALGSVVTSIFLLLRPLLIGLSRDVLKSYNLLIIVMSSSSCIYALLFVCLEPYLKSRKYRFRRVPSPIGINSRGTVN